MNVLFNKFITWIKSLFIQKNEPKTTTYEVPYIPVIETKQFSTTKAYADQRQKAPHNRHRKPSKAMVNLYQLKG